MSARLLRLAVPTLALALGAALAVALVSCGGGDDEGLLPGDDAQQIVENLNQVELDVANGDCDAAAENAAEVGDQIDALGGDVNAELKQRLEEGASELEQLISTDCVEATATITTTEETTTEEPTTEETTTGKQKTDTTTTDTTTTDTTTTTTIPTTTSQTTTGGGVTAPSPEEDD